jgi:endonuclease YncB( thermonuclease family)
MRALSLLIVFLTLPVCARAEAPKPQTLIFEKVIDGATIVASGRTVGLWGVTALDPADPAAFAAKLYLKTMLGKGALRCAPMGAARDRHAMHCTIDGADVGSLMVQMGMAKAAGRYYQGEEIAAQVKHRGIWHEKQDTPL